MDILTQGLLGASMAQAGARENDTRAAMVIGFLSGLLADVDVLIRSSADPLLTIEYHRHFTHSLFFVPVGALFATLVLWPFFRNRLTFGRIFIFALLGYSLSGVLDTCTSYGTYLLWPFVDKRIAWHIISIVDPIFTVALLAGVIYSYRKTTAIGARVGLVIAVLYLAFGWLQLQRAADSVIQLTEVRGHVPERLVVKPTIGNTVLWRSIYQSNGKLYVDAIRLGFTDANTVYEGGSIVLAVPERDFANLPVDTVLYQDILRFTRFSDGFIAIDPNQPNVLADVRYSNLPNSLAPLWGIEMDLTNADRHARYRFFRDLSPAKRKRFFSMLVGD